MMFVVRYVYQNAREQQNKFQKRTIDSIQIHNEQKKMARFVYWYFLKRETWLV